MAQSLYFEAIRRKPGKQIIYMTSFAPGKKLFFAVCGFMREFLLF
jgi:hypothetical protein